MMSINNQQDAVAQMNKYRSFVSMLVDPAAKDENKLKAAQELSENFETIQVSPHYGSFLDHAMKIFLKILSSGEPQFIAEHNVQQLRKLILEILHRLPANDYLKPFIKDLLATSFQLLEIDNEENVLVCLRIIIDIHKNFRPAFTPQTQTFLHFVRNVYKEIPNHVTKIFEPKLSKKVKELSDINVNTLLMETYGITNIQTEKKNSDGTSLSYNLIPKGVVSLRVLAELPVIVVLIYQLYKPNVQSEVIEILTLVFDLIILQPDPQIRASPNFNKEIFVDFMCAQVKAMSFIAYTMRMHLVSTMNKNLDIIQKHGPKLVEGTMNQLIHCPAECVHLRKELIIAFRHLLGTELRNEYLNQVSNILDENVMIGQGWTCRDALRILVYGTLADFVHHVRGLLKFEEYNLAIHLFSKISHDEFVPVSSQTMTLRLVLNLVDNIRSKSADQDESCRLRARSLIINMIQVFVMKFKTVAEIYLPTLLQKENADKTELRQKSAFTYVLPPDTKTTMDSNDGNKEKPKCNFPANPTPLYSVVDVRTLVKSLVCGSKTLTWGMTCCKPPTELLSKQLYPHEILLYIKLIKCGLIALDVYTLSIPGQSIGQRAAASQAQRSKDEKEILEHFAGVFAMFSADTFREVFTPVIDFFVNRLHKNYTLQIIANSLLASPAVSSVFSTILVVYLLDRMEAMGSNADKSGLYLKLFKLVFGSVSLFPQENEQMLKPHLHRIVNQSIELAKSAKDPYNYFLLLRALFRSIGGGSHDLLYQEFLPLLPNLLQGLNSLQSGDHKQVMKDLFVELSLTVPVRLSSLLPYLNKLMDPLVSALNGSQTLISQGLRTLELCVDNLQPDFLYDHIQPIGDKLMQALWRTLRNPSDNISRVAMRVLGKFGGGNRKMLGEPQKLEYNDRDSNGPSIDIVFAEYKTPVPIPVDKIVETAFKTLVLKDDSFYREQSWKVILCFLISTIELDCAGILQLLNHSSFTEGEILAQTPLYQCPDAHARKIHVLALAGMLVASVDKDIRTNAAPLVRAIVFQYTLVSISQCCGPFAANQKQRQWMDVQTLIDALAIIIGHENKDYIQPANLALLQMYELTTLILGSLERACRLPIWEYMAEKMCSLCYDKAWYAKHGGCNAIKFLCERMHLTWVLEHQFVFLRALLSVIMDLTGEVSYGVVNKAKANMDHMLELCCTPIKENETNKQLIEIQKKSLHEVTNELVKLIFSPNTFIREQCMHALELLARINNCSVTQIMEPHKEVLADMIPPKKHLLRHQSVNSQIGLMDGYTFCTTLVPRLFTIDMEIHGHNLFFGELKMICDTEDEKLLKLSCYKAVSNPLPIRTSALRALTACNYLIDKQPLIFNLIFKALDSPHVELQEEGFGCMKKFINGCQVEMEMIHIAMRPLLFNLGDYRSLNLSVILRLSHLTQLFPKTFNEKLCDQLLAHLRKGLEAAIHKGKTTDKKNANELKLCAAIIKIYHQIPAASKKFVEPLINLVMATEEQLAIEPCSPFREPLKLFLLRYPEETTEYFVNDANLANFKHSRYFEYLLKDDSGKPFRDILEKYSQKLIAAILDSIPNPSTGTAVMKCRSDKRYSALKIIKRMTKIDDQWLTNQHQLVACIRNVWISKDYYDSHSKPDMSAKNYYVQEPQIMVHCMLNFFKNHPKEIDLLFHLLRALSGHYVCNFHFLRSFLDQTVAKNYMIEWKRLAFFKFVEIFHNKSISQELKGYILQFILIPSFTVAFERGEGEKLIGGPPTPDSDPAENIISVFILKVIDPENPFATSDAVRILLLQLSCLFVENASPHIHDAANKRQGNKLRRLMTYAWPCLLNKNYVDPSTKYHGHLLLSYIISKFAIHKRIVLQVFHSLLKAHAPEAKNVVRQCLEIVTPAMPSRMEDGNSMLTHWTKKIIFEEGYSIPQLVHMLYLPVRHHKVYYKVRQYLLQNLITAMQRIGLSNSSSLDHKRLIVDLAEVIIKWELQYNRECQEQNEAIIDVGQSPQPGNKRPAAMVTDFQPEAKRIRTPSGAVVKTVNSESQKPIEKAHADAVVNLLLRIACHSHSHDQAAGTNQTIGYSGDLLSRRCISLVKTALRPDLWLNCELKLSWYDKLLLSIESPGPNINNICVALELLGYLFPIVAKETVLSCVKDLTKGVTACMNSTHTKVIRSVHVMLTKLMSVFPTEPSNSPVASKYEELTVLYAAVGKTVYDGLSNYEKNTNLPPTMLFGTLMILKAACSNNPSYIDRLLSYFMRVLQRMTKEHANTTTHEIANELLILSLDLVKSRVGVMALDMRKTFIGQTLIMLIEKTPEVKVLKAITRMVEDWVKTKPTPQNVSTLPSLREKSLLLGKMMTNVEKRFPNDLDLNAQFLELVNYVYRDESLIGSDMTSKLEPAFLAGLRCTQPHIRIKFSQAYGSCLKNNKLLERLLFICCSQNWENIGPHYWIKQCLELVLAVVNGSTTLKCSPFTYQLPSPTSLGNFADIQDPSNFSLISVKEEPLDVYNDSIKEEEEIDIELHSDDASKTQQSNIKSDHTPKQKLQQLMANHLKQLESFKELKTSSFLSSVIQLFHLDSQLAHNTWIELFPRLWKIMGDRHRQLLASELVPFMSSGCHLIQKDCQPSASTTFMEGVCRCTPAVNIRPNMLRYIGENYNMWHRSTLMLERLVYDNNPANHLPGKNVDCYEFEPTHPDKSTFDALIKMYSLLKEEDMWAGAWQKRAKYNETLVAIAYEQQGLFEQAQNAYELVINKARQDFNSSSSSNVMSEYKLWNDHWYRCTKELNQWDNILEIGNSKACADPYLVLESAWRVQNWSLMKDALNQVENNYPKESAFKMNLYQGYIAICHPDEHHLNLIEKLVDSATNLCIKEWRRLPHIVSHIHIPLLQAAQQVMELQEAAQINQGLLPANIGRSNSIHDMKAIVKTWRNRLPIISDDLSHWSDIFSWRQNHYQAIVSQYDSYTGHDSNANHSMLGVHASAQSIIHFGKVARKQKLTSVCLDSISKIHSIPSVPVIDCFHKIYQQLKCLLQLSGVLGTSELQEGLDVIESTNLMFFSKEMIAELYALKGVFLSQLGRQNDAEKAYSAAVAMYDILVKAWAVWGDFLEQSFTKDRNINVGVDAIVCYLHACRHQNESKSRKHLAKVIWLLTYDDKESKLASALETYSAGIPYLQWLPWIPQLLTCLMRAEGNKIHSLLGMVGRMFPQAVYFPVRTLYLTLKMELRERCVLRQMTSKPDGNALTPTKKLSVASPSPTATPSETLSDTPQQSNGKAATTTLAATTISEFGQLRADPAIMHCSRIMHNQRDCHTSVITSLEGMVDQMVWFRENWYEEVLRQLRQGLTKCYAVAFEKCEDVAEAEITQHTLNFLKKLVSTFGVGIESYNNLSSVSKNFSSSFSESLARRALATAQDPVFQRMKSQFTSDFDFSSKESMKLHNVIQRIKKWINILETKTKLLPKTLLIEEKCRFLSNFSHQTADVELPGELLLPKPTHNQFFVRISKFMPKVDIVQKHNTAARRLYIRGSNGKIYPYLIVNDACLTDSRREERVLQLLRMLNNFLGKQKETARRFLNFTVPRVVAVSPQLRLVEDNKSSISLLSIYKQRCDKQEIDYDAPIGRYYDRLATVQARGSQAGHSVLRDIMKEVQSATVLKTILKEWAVHTFPGPTDYWIFRKQFTLQLALAGFVEFVLHLTRLNPDMIYIHQDSGLMNVSYYRFDVNDATGELDANRPIPFRLTPNITEFITANGVTGPFTATIIATSRCLVQPSFKVTALLRAVLRDEYITWHRKKQDPELSEPPGIEGEKLISIVSKAVTAINGRLQSLATFEGAESKVSKLVAVAGSYDNLCRMDPAWHPWL